MTRRPRRRWPVLLVLFVAAVGLIVADQRLGPVNPVGVAARTWMGAALGPSQQVASSVGDGVQAVQRASQALTGTQAGTIEALEQKNAAMRSELNMVDFDRQRVSEVNALLHTAGLGQYRSVPARVVAVGASGGFSRSITIDVGSVDGVTVNETVMAAAGLVGKVTSVSATTSTVALIVDATTTVGVRLENQQAGYATGGGGINQPLTVDLFNPAAQVQQGMRLVTFGSPEGKPYVPGVPVGTVTAVEGLTGQLTKRVQVRPFVDFGSLDVVAVVVQPPRDNPRMAVLPPRPTPKPTPTVTVTVTTEPTLDVGQRPPSVQPTPTDRHTPSDQPTPTRQLR